MTTQSSDGCLKAFNREWGLQTLKVHEESGDFLWSGLQKALPALENQIAAFDGRYFFNADECGLLYKLVPDATVAVRRRDGQKKNKYCITVLVFANSDRSENIPLMFI